MNVIANISKLFASYIVNTEAKWRQKPYYFQEKILQKIISQAKNTFFGKEHNFQKIKNYEDFKKNVPLRDYEGLREYIEKIKNGEKDILWEGTPLYFAKTSGTTSGTKYIPISKESLPFHIKAARNALLYYIHETKNTSFLNGKLIFLSGSPILEKIHNIYVGRLSGIVNHHVPKYLRKNQLPAFSTNCIEDWEEKINTITEETLSQNMTLISGIPPWVQMYFSLLENKTSKKIKDIFPNFSLFVYGGVNFEPYKQKLFNSIGKKIDSIETFPASEGFFAFQDSQKTNGLLLLLNSGIFFEFIPIQEIHKPNPIRLHIEQVKLDTNYALIINSNAGLWGYNIGDIVKFVSLFPHKIIVTGRVKHFISAFGEHVIAEEVETALQRTLIHFPEVEIIEFTVSPNVNPFEGLPRHEWYIEFAKEPHNTKLFAKTIDENLQQINSYYADLVQGKVIQPLSIIHVKKNGFINYMKSMGKLGGQNKVPRLSNDRSITDKLTLIERDNI
ncbi:MAG: GH3 auxin-responsive promoter family protein [Chitinophagaceae bacterium]|nr:GH3 auxin-responsive promoter family protein [Chitinophagaceae bacterium]